MSRPIGSNAVLGGKKVKWAGENYGWQSPASYTKLEKEGKFKLGTQLIDRLGNYFGGLVPEPVKNTAAAVQRHMIENDKRVAARDSQTAVGRYFINPSKAVTQAPAKVQQAVIQQVSDITNTDPRIVGIAGEVASDLLIGRVGAMRGAPRVAAPTPPTTRQARGGGVGRGIQRQVQASRGVPVGEVGAVYPAGHPKAGQYMATGTRARHPNRDQLEAYGEYAWSRQQPGATSASTKGIPPVQLPDGSVASLKNEGAKNFKPDVKGGLTIQVNKPVPGKTYQTVDDLLGGSSKPNVSTKVTKAVEAYGVPAPAARQAVQRAESADLVALRQELIDAGLPDPELRFTPMDAAPRPATTKGARRNEADLVVRDPRLPNDLGPTATTPPVQSGALGVTADGPRQGPAIPGSAAAGQNYANAHLSIDGTGAARPFKVRETQAHHDKSPLKDSIDFVENLPDEYIQQFREGTQSQNIFSGNTQLNTRYLRQPYHQGDKLWPEAKAVAVHPNTRDQLSTKTGRVLEGSPSQDRWRFLKDLTPEQRMRYLPFFIADAKEVELLGMRAAFNQNLLQKGNDALNNAFGGNLTQHVLAPESMDALRIIAEKRRNARNILRINGP